MPNSLEREQIKDVFDSFMVSLNGRARTIHEHLFYKDNELRERVYALVARRKIRTKFELAVHIYKAYILGVELPLHKDKW